MPFPQDVFLFPGENNSSMSPLGFRNGVLLVESVLSVCFLELRIIRRSKIHYNAYKFKYRS